MFSYIRIEKLPRVRPNYAFSNNSDAVIWYFLRDLLKIFLALTVGISKSISHGTFLETRQFCSLHVYSAWLLGCLYIQNYIIAWGYSSMDKVLTVEEWGTEYRPTVATENEIIANKKKAKPNQNLLLIYMI